MPRPSASESLAERWPARPLTLGDIPSGLALCRGAGWNQIADDWELLIQHSRGAARVILSDGDVIGTVTALNYQNRFSWIGMVLVNERCRHLGLGSRLMSMALDALGACETVKLDATPAGRPVYLPLGFLDEWGLLRMEIVATPMAPPGGVSVREMGANDVQAVLAWDRAVFGADRGEILTRYWELAPQYARVAERGSNLAGYALGRRGFRWDQIGPIVATDRESAQGLMANLLSSHTGRRLLVDTPFADSLWVAWLRGVGFTEQRPYTRMYKGPNRYPGRPEQQYAILGPELG